MKTGKTIRSDFSPICEIPQNQNVTSGLLSIKQETCKGVSRQYGNKTIESTPAKFSNAREDDLKSANQSSINNNETLEMISIVDQEFEFLKKEKKLFHCQKVRKPIPEMWMPHKK